MGKHSIRPNRNSRSRVPKNNSDREVWRAKKAEVEAAEKMKRRESMVKAGIILDNPVQ